MHLEQMTPAFTEVVDLLSKPPIQLFCHALQLRVEQRPRSDGKFPVPVLLFIIPQLSTGLGGIQLPKALPGRVLFLEQFVGLIDELEEMDELEDFFDYLDEIEKFTMSPITSTLDKFGSFRGFHGVLIEGANEPDYVSIDPHWGSRLRYDSLKAFWSLYPEQGFFGHPRSWKVTQETGSRIVLEARDRRGVAFYSRIGTVDFFLNAPFHAIPYEQAEICNLLMECAEDCFSRYQEVIGQHSFFTAYAQFQVMLFPASLLANEQFQHLRHLDPHDRHWRSDFGFPAPHLPAVRVVFNDKKVAEAFEETKDRTLELELTFEILSHLNVLAPDANFDSLKAELWKDKTDQPRFKVFKVERPVAFPGLVRTYAPSPTHFKQVRKRIAKLARRLDIAEGRYDLVEAKEKLNALRTAVVNDINAEIAQYNLRDAVPELLTRIDALTHHWERRRSVLHHVADQDVDYDRTQTYAEGWDEYLRKYRNYRYLIEKFVQLQPNGEKPLTEDRCNYFLALIDWILSIYFASDALHYDIDPVGITIKEDYLVEIEYEGNFKTREEAYAKEEAAIALSRQDQDDRVGSPRPVEQFLDDLDRAFQQDLNFGLRSMLNVLELCSRWTLYRSGVEERPYYSAFAAEIQETCLENIQGIGPEEVIPILDFLTLKSDDVVRIVGQHEPCEDIPLWEYRKRYARYTLKPLTLIGERYYWGPYSARVTARTWTNAILRGSLPADIGSVRVEDALNNEKKLIEQALVTKTVEIVKRYTSYMQQEVQLHKVDKRGQHPLDLGDYDVLAYYPEKNVVLNIECKDLLPAFCLKDAKRLREKIFGMEGGEVGYLTRLNKRQRHLEDHVARIAPTLGWPMDAAKRPRIIPIYLARTMYWWTRFPPAGVETIFLRIDGLDRFISELNDDGD